jgi:hypothetical protein
MGFDMKVAKRNLKRANNDLGKALDYIREEQFNGTVNVFEKEDGDRYFSSRFVPFTNN